MTVFLPYLNLNTTSCGKLYPDLFLEIPQQTPTRRIPGFGLRNRKRGTDSLETDNILKLMGQNNKTQDSPMLFSLLERGVRPEAAVEGYPPNFRQVIVPIEHDEHGQIVSDKLRLPREKLLQRPHHFPHRRQAQRSGICLSTDERVPQLAQKVHQTASRGGTEGEREGGKEGE